MTAAAPGADPPLAVHQSANLLLASAETSAATAHEPPPPLPVFASGNAQLEQRLLQTFAALRIPRGPPAATPGAAAAGSVAADNEIVEHPRSTSVPHAEGLLAARQTPRAAAATASEMCASPAEADAEREAPATTATAQVTAACASDSSRGAAPIASSEQPACRNLAATDSGAREAEAAVAAAGAAGGNDFPEAPRGRGVQEQQGTLLRRPAAARGESPGACSEATDSTRCTDTSEVVRPPAFGSWRHYSLADVPEESMSAAGMQRACQLMLQQLRRATVTAETAAPGAAPTFSAASQAATVAAATPFAPAAAGETAATAEAEPEDPRVRVGPRRRV
ncbi:uncharacterized protein EMH_0006540 [Eimeria mitis]|uniref:Uncharacterized protein n=1 Tax=Eimeria mitis TaxID=44415 RepID=U6KDL8_9EIME|nr:uncharacterized protein EMH_0006540 [Eimeria mitis]CDJ36049.1 hypothetical protein, conserved [Eimeria mitis]